MRFRGGVLGSGVEVLELRDQSFRHQDLGFDLSLRVQGSGFRFSGLRF